MSPTWHSILAQQHYTTDAPAQNQPQRLHVAHATIAILFPLSTHYFFPCANFCPPVFVFLTGSGRLASEQASVWNLRAYILLDCFFCVLPFPVSHDYVSFVLCVTGAFLVLYATRHHGEKVWSRMGWGAVALVTMDDRGDYTTQAVLLRGQHSNVGIRQQSVYLVFSRPKALLKVSLVNVCIMTGAGGTSRIRGNPYSVATACSANFFFRLLSFVFGRQGGFGRSWMGFSIELFFLFSLSPVLNSRAGWMSR